jgi:mono/diheme cytochrome c family protein
MDRIAELRGHAGLTCRADVSHHLAASADPGKSSCPPTAPPLWWVNRPRRAAPTLVPGICRGGRMRARTLFILAAALVPASVLAQPRPDLGRFEYESNCASCHGPTGRGDGEVGRGLKQPLPDLSTLNLRNGGVFPAERVRQVIDGRAELKGHMSRSMPIWGLQYGRQAPEFYRGRVPEPEAFVRQRIDALVEYLRTLQASQGGASK